MLLVNMFGYLSSASRTKYVTICIIFAIWDLSSSEQVECELFEYYTFAFKHEEQNCSTAV